MNHPDNPVRFSYGKMTMRIMVHNGHFWMREWREVYLDRPLDISTNQELDGLVRYRPVLEDKEELREIVDGYMEIITRP